MSTFIVDNKRSLTFVIQALTIIGAVNWGLIGLAEFDLVKWLLGETASSQAVYLTVGLAGIGQLIQLLMAEQRRP